MIWTKPDTFIKALLVKIKRKIFYERMIPKFKQTCKPKEVHRGKNFFQNENKSIVMLFRIVEYVLYYDYVHKKHIYCRYHQF